MRTRTPLISIVIVAGNVRNRAARTLASVLEQEGIDNQEVILIDAGSSEADPLPGTDHRSVRLIRTDGSMHFGQLRGHGVRLAKGQVIAFLEDHVLAHSGWLNAVAASFSNDWAAVGPEVHPGNPGLGISDAVNFVGYGLWIPPLERGVVELLPGNNTSYRRSALLRYATQLDGLLLTDTVLQMRLRKDGYRLYAEPEARISHLSPTSFRTAATAEYLYHQCFAAVRAETFAWSRLRRLEYLLRCPIVPWVRLARLGRFVIRRRPQQRALFIAQLVPTAAVLHAAVYGQAAGLSFAAAEDAARRFTQFELNCPRPTASEVS